MTAQKMTDDQLKQCILDGMTTAAIAGLFKMHERRVWDRRAMLARQGWSPEHGLKVEYPDGFKVGKTTIQRGPDGTIERTWERMCEDPEKLQALMQRSMQAMVEGLPKFKAQPLAALEVDHDLLAVYPLGDPHIGMMSWGAETGQDWDLKIAERYFCKAFDRVVRTTPHCKQALILNLGDFFHADNMEGVTTRSKHSLDVDGRYAKMISVGVKIMRQMIETALEVHDTVRVINCIGNHDDTGSQFLAVLLMHVYELEPRVIIDVSPTPFHYMRWGKVLLGAHHGHTCKAPGLPAVMAASRPEDWGATNYRYWYTGHIHHDTLKEYPGVKVESFRTMAAADAYATWGGYISGQDIKAIVLHKNKGEVERHTVHIDHLRDAKGLHI